MIATKSLLLAFFFGCFFAPCLAQPAVWGPFNTTAAETQYIIDTYAGTEMVNYAKSVGVNITVTNNLRESWRGVPFIELLYPNGSTSAENFTFYDVWNSALVQDQPNTNQNQQLDFSSDPPEVYNYNKRLTFDMLLMALPSQEMLTPLPLYKYFPFVSNPAVNVTYRYFSSTLARVPPAGESASYNAEYYSSVYRQSTFLYYPQTLAYLLIFRDPTNNETSLYVMQAFSNQNNNQMTFDQLTLQPVAPTATTNPVKPSIITPENWTFAYINLEQMLTVQAYGEAKIITDNLNNAYMYIYRDSSTEWLYSRFDYTSNIPSGPKPPAAPPASAPPASGTAAAKQSFGLLSAVLVIFLALI